MTHFGAPVVTKGDVVGEVRLVADDLLSGGELRQGLFEPGLLIEEATCDCEGGDDDDGRCRERGKKNPSRFFPGSKSLAARSLTHIPPLSRGAFPPQRQSRVNRQTLTTFPPEAPWERLGASRAKGVERGLVFPLTSVDFRVVVIRRALVDEALGAG